MSVIDDAVQSLDAKQQRRQKRAGGALSPEEQGRLQAKAAALEAVLEAGLPPEAQQRVMAALRARGVL